MVQRVVAHHGHENRRLGWRLTAACCKHKCRRLVQRALDELVWGRPRSSARARGHEGAARAPAAPRGDGAACARARSLEGQRAHGLRNGVSMLRRATAGRRAWRRGRGFSGVAACLRPGRLARAAQRLPGSGIGVALAGWTTGFPRPWPSLHALGRGAVGQDQRALAEYARLGQRASRAVGR